MTFPWFALASTAVGAIGACGMAWYYNLSKAEREQADRLAAQYAKQLYNTTIEHLTSHQRSAVNELVKASFAR